MGRAVLGMSGVVSCRVPWSRVVSHHLRSFFCFFGSKSLTAVIGMSPCRELLAVIVSRFVLVDHVVSPRVISYHVMSRHVVSCLGVSRWFVASRPARVVGRSPWQESLTRVLDKSP